MGIIVLLITISLSIALLFLSVFFWSIRSGQFDDTYTPSVRMLFENDHKQEVNVNSSEKTVNKR